MGTKPSSLGSNNKTESLNQEKSTLRIGAVIQFRIIKEKGLTNEEEIEKKYRGKNHPDCNQAIYSKGKENIRKLFGNHECCTIGPSQHFWDDYSGFVGCDNCVILWKRDEEIKKNTTQENNS